MLIALLLASSLAANLDARIAELTKTGQFSGVVLVSQGGKTVYAHAGGLRNVAEGTRIDLDTKFNLGSMNKMFTAVAIAQLQEAGKLSYDDKLGKHLPAYPDAAVRDLTLHQLLTHTSGLGDYFGPKFSASKDEISRISNYLPLFAGTPLEFAPGTRWRYSNVGFILLGAVIEKVSGQSYDDYVRAHIFAPAGMKDTDAYAKNAIVPNLAVGYTRLCQPGQEQVAGDAPLCSNVTHLPFRGSAAGGGYSTAGDLLRFANALRANKLVSAASLQTLTTGKAEMKAPPGVKAKYGYGFGDVERDGLRSFGHNGGAPGIASELTVYPDHDAVVVVLTNHDMPEGTVEQLRRIAEASLRSEPKVVAQSGAR